MTTSLSISNSNLSAFFADADNAPACPRSPPAPSPNLVRSFSAMNVREIPTTLAPQYGVGTVAAEKLADNNHKLRPWERFARWQKLHPSANRHEARAFIEQALRSLGNSGIPSSCGANTSCGGVARSPPRAAI